MEAKEIRKQIRDLIAKKGPVSRREILSAFGSKDVSNEEIEKTLNKLVSLQVLYPCSRQRIWDKDEKALLVAEAKKLIASEPQTRVTLSRELEKLQTGASLNYLRQVLFEKLQDDPEIFLHFGRNGQLLSTDKPDPTETLKPVIPRVLSLQKAGFDRSALESVLFGSSEPRKVNGVRSIQHPSEETELDFQRDACELLVFAWQDTDCEETRASLEGVMVSLGLDRVEESESETEYNGIVHHCSQKISKGQKVRVLQSGWRLKNRRGDYLITKAQVQNFT